MIIKEINFGDSVAYIEHGALARNAHGSIVIKCEGTQILCTVCLGPKDNSFQNSLKLKVDYFEPSVAFGNIPGGFFKRDGKPSEREVLVSRIIDRAMRANIKMCNRDIHLTCSILTNGNKYDSIVLAIIGASAAIENAGLPMLSSVAAIQIGMNGSQFVINPTITEMQSSDLNLIAAVNNNGITMIEANANMLDENLMVEALSMCHEQGQLIISAIQSFRREIIQIDEIQYESTELDIALKPYSERIVEAYRIDNKPKMIEAVENIYEEIYANMPDEDADKIQHICKEQVCAISREQIIKTKKRFDQRANDEIREIKCEINPLDGQAHGSAIFTRGHTQVLSTVTIGGDQERQTMDYLGKEYKENFILHYNFPKFCVGEVAKIGRMTGRREIGHGYLAKKGLLPIFKAANTNNYTVRINADVLESDGSSSMATVCSGSLALMASGINTKGHVAGIAMGLIIDTNTKEEVILTDISGKEDAIGDIDFKITGNADGISALQMDIKSEGISMSTIKSAIHQGVKDKNKILSILEDTISKSIENHKIPSIHNMTIPVNVIKNIIGSGGENIKRICAEFEVQVNVEKNGQTSISGNKDNILKAAKDINNTITAIQSKPAKDYGGGGPSGSKGGSRNHSKHKRDRRSKY